MTIYGPGLESEPSLPIVVETRELAMGAVDPVEGIVAPEAGAHDYLKGVEAQIAAMPAEGYLFTGWTGDAVADSDNVVTTVTMDDDKSVQATFALSRQLTILSTGGGTTTPASGIYQKKYGVKVSVSAVANEGYVFKEWRQDSTAVTPDISVTMDDDKIVLAVFEQEVAATSSDVILYASTDPGDEGIDYNDNGQWIPVATMNHDSLSNLNNDTHKQYLDETRHDETERHTLGDVVPHDSHTELSDTGSYTHDQLDDHVDDLTNPHQVTAGQVGALAKLMGVSLPPASAVYRGQFAAVMGSVGPPAVEDILYYCRSTDGGTTYEWKIVTLT